MRRALHCIAIKSLWTAETWATIYLEEATQIIDICIKVRDMRCHDLDESLVAHYRLDVHWRFDAFGELEDSRRYPCPPSTYIVPEVVGINGNIYAFRREFEEYTILLRQHEKNEFANFYQKNLQIFSLQHNIF